VKRARARATAQRGTERSVAGNLEYAFLYDGVCVAAGWANGLAEVVDPILDVATYRYVRDDVNQAGALSSDAQSGFMLFARSRAGLSGPDLVDTVRARLRALGVDGAPGSLSDFTAGGDYSFRLLAAALAALPTDGDRTPFASLSRLLPRGGTASRPWQEDVDEDGPRAHVDHCMRIGGADLLVISGWTRRDATIEILDLVPGQGARSAFVQWTSRADVLNGIGPDYSGFIATTRGAVGASPSLRIRFTQGGERSELNTVVTPVSGDDPVRVVRQLFEIPTHARDFVRRLNDGEGEAIAQLIEARRERLGTEAYSIIRQHEATDIELSVIIPLFQRYDLLWNQFLSWAQAPSRARIELILVNDDPRHDVECSELVDQIQSVFGLNVTLVANHANRGYAGANNVGARLARGSSLMLLNSDAFLDDAEASLAGVDLLREHPEIGLVGAVIHDADGLVIHRELACVYLESRSSWFNYHPGTGFPMTATSSHAWWPVDAVTGAVMIMRKSDYLAMGGLSEDFLIGDYEDSDLCWRLAADGKRVVVSDDVRAVHSERTSMSLLGTDDFREKVSLFNSWLHARRWGHELGARFDDRQRGRNS
jgi:GT2 family glycosyltransferase